MFRSLLPAALCAATAFAAHAEDLRVPGLSSDPHKQTLDLPACENTRDQNACARFLACVGEDGLYLDGQARGWGKGTLAGQRSDGVVCGGNWEAGAGPFGTGIATFKCEDGVEGQAIYFTQDPETGTGTARGMDNKGRIIQAWSGQNVLEFLGDGDALKAELPCTKDPIPIS